MQHRIRYMHVKYQLNQNNRSATIVITKTINKLHKFTTCHSNFEKLLLSDMHHSTPNNCVEFETNRLVSYSATAFQSIFLRATDRRTDGQTSRVTTYGSFFQKEKKLLKRCLISSNGKSRTAHTEPLLKTMNQLKLVDMYNSKLLKFYYKLYRNQLPCYLVAFLLHMALLIIH